ncbi:hypothetical protein J7E83_02970 [Arthrobacter sp. ISL-48]|uniref:cyclophilin-like fold protein n=1 Tax=Arthrobacter sp. ISL-48 TaxID=2819110 RepID=UPI001BE6AF91|nr:cyclophilin-like fold protein [Arthrobacter sp. ISL-48]MBT2531100.1 hypothetical protein [Arthrobacter sp. ISL-48]
MMKPRPARRITLTIGDGVVAASLNDTDAARDLASLLPTASSFTLNQSAVHFAADEFNGRLRVPFGDWLCLAD